jgi:hypothetical protein
LTESPCVECSTHEGSSIYICPKRIDAGYSFDVAIFL